MSESNLDTEPIASQLNPHAAEFASNHGSFCPPDVDGGGQSSQPQPGSVGRKNKGKGSHHGSGRGSQGSGRGSRGRGSRGNPGRHHNDIPTGSSGVPMQSMTSQSPGSRSAMDASPPSRGYNANHLLNFRQQPRPKQERHASGRKGRASRANPYSREVFLQANYRFAVTGSADIKALETDADRMIDWDDVVQVDVLVDRTEEHPNCPITLEPLVCPHMTACGHIFSFPAIIQHAVNHGGPELRAAAPCPLCFTPVVVRELRPARIVPITPLLVGAMAQFRFLCRPRDSILPQKHGVPLPGHDESSEQYPLEQYAKFRMSDNPTSLLHDLASDIACYAARVTAEDSIEASAEVSTCHHAISLLAARAAVLATRRAERLNPSVDRKEIDLAADDARAIVGAASKTLVELCELAREEAKVNARNAVLAAQQAEAEQQRRELFPSLGETFGAEYSAVSQGLATAVSPLEDPLLNTSPSTAVDLPIDQLEIGSPLDETLLLLGTSPTGSTGVSMGRENENWHFYFQAEDGQWAFMHPLNLRCLKAHFGSYAAIPASMSAPVVEIEELVQSEEIRKRLKSLSHLPLAAEFHLVEVDLSGMLPPEVLVPFAAELTEREKRRQRKSKALAREAARDARRQAAEAKSQKGPSLEEWRQQPALPSQASAEQMDDITGTLELEQADEDTGGSSGQSAWANIARMGFAAALDSPSLGNDQHGAPGPVGPWGTPGPSNPSPSGRAQQPVGLQGQDLGSTSQSSQGSMWGPSSFVAGGGAGQWAASTGGKKGKGKKGKAGKGQKVNLALLGFQSGVDYSAFERPDDE